MLYKQFLVESREKQIQSFTSFVKDYLGLDDLPEIVVINDPKFSIENKTFGCFDLMNDIIKIQVANRHPLDFCRTLAHELVHYKQKISGNEMSGDTGSNCENEANSTAGEIMRHYTKTIENHGY
jgi:transcription initiation factor IIF auxiliary subunit